MTSKELYKIISLERIKNKQANDTTKVKELESLLDELEDSKIVNPGNVDTWVKSKGGQLANFGLDANEKINEILTKSDKEIYGKIPELQDKEYLDKLDKFSIAKLRSDARKNGFPSVQDYIQAAYKFKADREFMKSFEQDPKAGYLDKAQDWITQNFYPNAYEAIKNQPVNDTSSNYKIGNSRIADKMLNAAGVGVPNNNKIRNSLIADQILNAAAVGTAPIGGLFKQMLLGGGNALASEVAGKYFSNKDIDPLQVGIGAGLGAFGGRVAGKSAGDLIKGGASRFGLKPNGDNVGKVIYGIGDALEGAAIDPKSEVAMARKASEKWLGPTWDEMRTKEIAQMLNNPKLTKAQKHQELLKIGDNLKFVNENVPEIRHNTRSVELLNIDEDGLLKHKEKLANSEKSRKDYWRQSLKNQLPTDENIQLNKDILKYSDPKYNHFKSKDLPSDLTLYEVDKPIIALEGQTGIPFRKAWAEPKFSSSLRTMLQGASQLGARKSREMDEDDIESIYNSILENKPKDVKNYNSGLDNNLTPYEKDIIQKFYIGK